MGWRLSSLPALAWRVLSAPLRGSSREKERLAPLPDAAPSEAAEGEGDLFHRRYEVLIERPRLSPEEVMARLQAEPDRFVSHEFARYHKTRGQPGSMEEGDEFLVELTGPWDGPVAVVQRNERSFTLATRQGHMEAGRIQFSVHPRTPHMIFRVESWARSRDALVDLAYDKLGVAKAVQKEFWTSFCENVCKESGGAKLGPVHVETERRSKSTSPEATA